MPCSCQQRARVDGIEAIALTMGVTRRTAFRWLHKGLPVRPSGLNRWWAYEDDLHRWAAERRCHHLSPPARVGSVAPPRGE